MLWLLQGALSVPVPSPSQCGTGLGTPCCTCFPSCVFHQNLKMAVDPAAAQQGPREAGEGSGPSR